jgi:uncharacterized protein with NRDE domain
MCLLVVCSRVIPGFPLVVAANRDERFDRPAVPITTLQETSPVILGGRDELAGGTWLAVNDRGVVAGLTNRPSAFGRDPNRRSRGELPLLLASYESAAAAAPRFAAAVEPSRYNPAWVLVGDRESLYYLELDGANPVASRPLAAGIHILENLPLDVASTKVDRAREVLGDPSPLSARALVERLALVLADHQIASPSRPFESAVRSDDAPRRPACVHGDSYGTRSSMILLVPADATPTGIHVADGRPCETAFVDETARWSFDSARR